MNSPNAPLPRPKTALITGITGQDGSYLSELLLGKGYEVHGIVRRASMFNRSRIEHLRANPDLYGRSLFLHYADLNDATPLRRIIQRVRPDELYHLGGQSHVGLSFEIPESTCEEIASATLGLLEILRDLDYPVKFYLAGSSEMFGQPDESPQNELTAFRPTSPYGCAKSFASNLCRVYRDAYGMLACTGITFNHESPRRGENFVTRKITHGAARIADNELDELVLGNLAATRDWGYALEYVEAMWAMLQVPHPRDYVIATGVSTSVRAFAQAAFDEAGVSVVFEGDGVAEIGRRTDNGAVVIRVNPKFYRPSDPSILRGDASAIQRDLGWQPRLKGTDVARLMLRSEPTRAGLLRQPESVAFAHTAPT